MRLTWHIVLKDLTRMRLPMAFWAALFLAEFAVGVRFLNAGAMSFASYGQLQILDAILFGLRVAIGYLMVAALLFDDPLVGSTAFWPTRPISGSRLLGAKLLASLLIFGLLPILVTLPWWLYCGYGIRQVWEASVDSLWSQATPLAVGFLIGALTGSVARFLVWTLVAIAAAGIAFAEIVKPASTHLFVHGMDITVDSPGAATARFMTLCVIAVAGWAVVVLHQFLTRRLVRSLVLLAVAAGLLGAEATWWPLAFRDRSLDMAARAAGAALDGRVTIQPSRDASLHIEQDPGIESGTVIFGNITVDGSPPELLMSCDRMEFTWLWPDGGIARAQGILLGRPLPSLRQWQSATPHKEAPASALEQSASRQQKLKNGNLGPYQDFLRENPMNRVWDYYVEVPRPESLRMLTDPPTCTIDFEGDLLQPMLAAEVPLARGGAWAGSGEGFRIARREWNDTRRMLEVSVVEHRAAIGGSFNPLSPSFDPSRYSSELNLKSIYPVINRRTGESALPLSFSGYNLPIRIATVAIAWRQLEFVGPSNIVTPFPNLDYGKWAGQSFEDWFSDATLGRVEETAVGRFSRKVTVGRFSVTPDIFSKAP